MSRIYAIIIVLVSGMFCNNLNISYCHPHMYIEHFNAVVFNEKGLDGFRIKWLFDEMFTATILNDYDKDNNTHFNLDEEKLVYNRVFENLKEAHYFCDIEIEGDQFVVEFVKDFHADVQDNKLVFTFFVPCPLFASNVRKKVVMCVYDKTCFVDIYMQDKNLHFENADKYEFNYTIKENYDKSFLAPKEVALFFAEIPK